MCKRKESDTVSKTIREWIEQANEFKDIAPDDPVVKAALEYWQSRLETLNATRAAFAVIVPRNHYDDFIRHHDFEFNQGFWAVMDKPPLQPGDLVWFEIPGGPVPYLQKLRATVDRCELVTDPSRGLVGWWRIDYSGAFEEPKAPLPEINVQIDPEKAVTEDRNLKIHSDFRPENLVRDKATGEVMPRKAATERIRDICNSVIDNDRYEDAT